MTIFHYNWKKKVSIAKHIEKPSYFLSWVVVAIHCEKERKVSEENYKTNPKNFKMFLCFTRAHTPASRRNCAKSSSPFTVKHLKAHCILFHNASKPNIINNQKRRKTKLYINAPPPLPIDLPNCISFGSISKTEIFFSSGTVKLLLRLDFFTATAFFRPNSELLLRRDLFSLYAWMLFLATLLLDRGLAGKIIMRLLIRTYSVTFEDTALPPLHFIKIRSLGIFICKRV